MLNIFNSMFRNANEAHSFKLQHLTADMALPRSIRSPLTRTHQNAERVGTKICRTCSN